MSQFVILSLPRSRSFWASRFLTYGPWACGHDEISRLRRPGDLASWWALPQWGSCETAGAYWWRAIPPDVRIATIRRPVGDVVDSLARLFPFNRQVMEREMQRLDAKLDQVEARRDCLSLDFHEMALEEPCAELFEHCLGLPHDPKWWRQMAPLNLQIDLRKQVQYCMAYRGQLEQMAGTMRAEALRTMRAKAPPALDGIVLAQEGFGQWVRDGKALFAEHSAAVDEAADSYSQKNAELMAKLDAQGELQILTARCNGRMLGYLVSLVIPSLESPGWKSGLQTTFFVGVDAPKGLGLRLQRTSVEMLKAKGVREVLFHAGTRGSGPKMGPLYRRLGAELCGQGYRLGVG